MSDLQPSDLMSDINAAWDNLAADKPAEKVVEEPAEKAESDKGKGVPAKYGEVGTIEKTLKSDKAAETKPKVEQVVKGAKPDEKVVNKEGAKVEPVKPAFEVPKTWPKAVQDRIASIKDPEDAKFVIEQYEFMKGEHERNKTLYTPARQLHESLESVLAPTRQQRQLNRLDDASYLKGLVAADEYLQKSPVEAIDWIAKQYGVDLNKFNEYQNPAQIDPQFAEIRRELQEAKQQIASLTQGTKESAEKSIMDQLSSFADEVNAEGQKVRPYFDDVAEEMKVVLAMQRYNGDVFDLNAAYNKAIRMNEQVWLKIQEAQAESSKKEREAARLKEIEDAKRAGYSVSGSGDTHDQPSDDLRVELARQYDKLYAH